MYGWHGALKTAADSPVSTILIAHRISTIEQMDKVLFIDGGRLAGFGTHDKLYETNAEYRKMVDLQRLEEEGGEQNA